MYMKPYAQPLFRSIVSTLNAIANCRKSGDAQWIDNHEADLDWMEKQLPSGSGIDCGCKIDREKSTDNRLVVTFSFHHMDENGMYCGWSDYKCIVTPSLQFDHSIRITGRDRNGLKDYLHETFDYCLTRKVWKESDGTRVNGMYYREPTELPATI